MLGANRVDLAASIVNIGSGTSAGCGSWHRGYKRRKDWLAQLGFDELAASALREPTNLAAFTMGRFLKVKVNIEGMKFPRYQ
jgi:hypothetical protein